MKKLDNKGFTLIELLAVVVILAVVMGIAMNSVLSSMNKARGGSLQDTAQVIANAFNQKYTEALVGGVPTKVYSDVSGFSTGYNFSSTKGYYIDTHLADTFNISTSNYVLGNGATSLNLSGSSVSTDVNTSFVVYNSTNGKFVVCMVANSSGSNFVSAYKTSAAVKLSELGDSNKPAGIKSNDTTYNAVGLAANVMMACSDGTRTWN